MSGLRPITDLWLLARPKVKLYGAYPVGFLPRARPLVGATETDCVLHVCSGLVQQNDGRKVGGIPLRGFGPNDLTMDIDLEVGPDFCVDVRELDRLQIDPVGRIYGYPLPPDVGFSAPRAILIDRPYSKAHARHYRCGPDVLPDLKKLVTDSLRIVRPGGCVGVLDFIWPAMGKKNAKNLAAVAVSTGEGSRVRLFTVWRNA